ncbi:hypothetical protein QFZ28_003092 [Neobacillus niacini]|nr:hypothetical protein [Neobacillus niacini]
MNFFEKLTEEAKDSEQMKFEEMSKKIKLFVKE